MTTARAIRPPHSSYSGLDRVLLHVGLALVTWSRRGHNSAPKFDPALYVADHHHADLHRVSGAQEQATALLYFRMH